MALHQQRGALAVGGAEVAVRRGIEEGVGRFAPGRGEGDGARGGEVGRADAGFAAARRRTSQRPSGRSDADDRRGRGGRTGLHRRRCRPGGRAGCGSPCRGWRPLRGPRAAGAEVEAPQAPDAVPAGRADDDRRPVRAGSRVAGCGRGRSRRWRCRRPTAAGRTRPPSGRGARRRRPRPDGRGSTSRSGRRRSRGGRPAPTPAGRWPPGPRRPGRARVRGRRASPGRRRRAGRRRPSRPRPARRPTARCRPRACWGGSRRARTGGRRPG